MENKKRIFNRVLLVVIIILLINIGLFLYKYMDFTRGLTGSSIKETISKAHQAPLNSKIFLTTQLATLMLGLFLAKPKAQANIITVVLLILVSIVAITIVSGIVMNSIKDASPGIGCFDVLGQLEIDGGSEYTCYEELITGEKLVMVTIKRGLKKINIEKFIIAIFSGGNSKTFEIKEGETSINIEMIEGGEIEIPKQLESKSYRITTDFTGDIDYVEVAPVAGEQICGSTDKENIGIC